MTVLLACRNGARYIERQLDSVLAQEGVDVQLEVRDDDSVDATRAIVAARGERDCRIRLWSDHSASGSAGANFFALVAAVSVDKADYVAFCDQDDEWHVGKLARAVAVMRSDGATGYSAPVLACWEDGRSRVLVQDPRISSADHLFEGAGQGCTFVFAAPLFKRLQQLVRTHVELLAPLHYHDWTLYALARAGGDRWCFDDRPVLDYRQHGGNDTGARSSGGGIARRLALIRSGWYAAQVKAVASLLIAAYPAHQPAAQWLELTRRGRLPRMQYLVRNGRRRPIDRAIQTAAAAMGYL